MQPRNPVARRSRFAPLHTGAILFAAAWLLASCKERPPSTTPGDPLADGPATVSNSAAPTASGDPAADPSKPATASPQRAKSGPVTLRFVAYNLENWLITDRTVDDKPVKSAPKPDSEKRACVRIIAAAKPEILGICEIGTRDDALDVQTRLKAAGLDLPHLHYTGGADDVRHLALLSKFPLKPNDPGPLRYRLEGSEFGMQRGILDASVSVAGKPFRFLGVHLKSKREVEEGNQEQMRRNEADLLRRHVEKLLAQDPKARLVVYGDFNDTRGSSVLRGVQGPYHSPLYLTPLPMNDLQGERWTHHWEFQDVYSRFDYIMVSQALKPEVDFRASRILDDREWNQASDHRAVLAVFR